MREWLPPHGDAQEQAAAYCNFPGIFRGKSAQPALFFLHLRGLGMLGREILLHLGRHGFVMG